MKFDWLTFCNQNQIHYVTSGPNTGRNNISVKCPWCGDADPSQHLGLSLDVNNPVWGCLRNPQHRGANPRRLVQRLLRCSFEAAVNLVKAQNIALPDDFDTLLTTRAGVETVAVTTPTPFVRPKEFRDFDTLSRYTMRFVDYIAEERGFGEDALAVCKQYGLWYALTGDYAWRIITPVYDVDQQLRNWVGRAVQQDAVLRYRNATESDKTLLFNEPRARQLCFQCPTLFVVEGVWDCMKVDFYGSKNYATSVAILGTSITQEQLARLSLLARMFKRVVVLMDPTAFDVGLFIESALSGTSRTETVLGAIPNTVEDPGALAPQEVETLCRTYCVQR